MTRVLILDDRPINRQFLSTLLGYKKYETREAANGLEGLQIAQEWDPELAIVDIRMPVMDGIEFVRRVRADPKLASMALIYYTASYDAATGVLTRCRSLRRHHWPGSASEGGKTWIPHGFSPGKGSLSGRTHGRTSGKCFAAIWSSCTMTSWRNGLPNPASRRRVFFRRRVLLRRTRARP